MDNFNIQLDEALFGQPEPGTVQYKPSLWRRFGFGGVKGAVGRLIADRLKKGRTVGAQKKILSDFAEETYEVIKAIQKALEIQYVKEKEKEKENIKINR